MPHPTPAATPNPVRAEMDRLRSELAATEAARRDAFTALAAVIVEQGGEVTVSIRTLAALPLYPEVEFERVSSGARRLRVRA